VISVEKFVFDGGCDECDYDKPLDAFEDTDTGVWGYTCPECGHQHEEELALDGEYDTWDEWWIDNE
jgi:hypothetical protein